jgi:DNA repair protein RecN (Recombination protein N)
MLKRLSINNYAIIDNLEIDFSPQLNIITGETGAGKSIIVGALGLILGERADSTVLVNKEKKCIVEGIFSADVKKVTDFFKDNELDADDEVVVRREIGINGKSRAFINDTPVNLSQMQLLATLLVDLHKQFDTLELGEVDFQREVIDALGGNAVPLINYQELFFNWQQVTKEYQELSNQKQQFNKEADYNRFQYDELAEAGFTDDELEKGETTLKMLSNAEGIKAALSKAYFELAEDELPMVQRIKSLQSLLQGYQAYHPDLPFLTERLQSVHIELKDIAGEVDRIGDHINYDPAKIDALNERLSVGYKLLKKHGVSTTAELLVIQKQFEQKLRAEMDIDEAIEQKEKESSLLLKQAREMAAKLSVIRNRQVKPLESSVNKLLVQVGMPNAKLKVVVQDQQELNRYGADRIEFLFNANLPSGENGHDNQYQPVHKIASGGELSRLMLCIKSLVAQSIDLPTMIFDEIDSGVSGEAARQVGIILKRLAANRQIICITHQPQIAGKADAHFFVYKEIVNNAIKTNIRRLGNEERITTIAKMLSGEKPTAAAMENAREIVRN